MSLPTCEGGKTSIHNRAVVFIFFIVAVHKNHSSLNDNCDLSQIVELTPKLKPILVYNNDAVLRGHYKQAVKYEVPIVVN